MKLVEGKLVFLVAAAFIAVSSNALKLGKCPPPTLKHIVADYLGCHPLSRYHCLYDSSHRIYSTHCFTAQRMSPGGYVFLEGRLNSRSCPKSHYQPKPYWSSDFNECVYLKSQCNEEGQVIYENGLTYTDRLCRCDYTRGYDFLYKPTNPCFCQPSIEDCSCYLKNCSNNVKGLTPDYQCEQSGGLVICPIIRHTQGDTTTSPVDRTVPSSERDIRLDNTFYNLSGRENGVQKSAIIALVIVAIICILVFSVIWIMRELLRMKGLTYEEVSAKAKIKMAMSDECYVEPSNYKVIEQVIQGQKLLLLTGRKGSGKLTTALHLAYQFLKENYRCVLLMSEDIKQNLFFPRGKEKYLVVFYLEHSLDDKVKKAQREQIQHLFGYIGEMKIIILTHTLSMEMIEVLRRIKTLHVSIEKSHFDIEYTENEKENMLDNFFKRYEINACDRGMRKEIVNCQLYLGFPLMCFDFCSDPDLFKLGTLFFNQPPEILVYEIDQMLERGRNNSADAYSYCALVHIMLEQERCPVDLNTDKIEGLMSQVFKVNGIVLSETTIRNAVHILLEKYLEKAHRDIYVFQHQSIYDAVLVSYGNLFPKEVAKYCDLKSLMLLARPKHYAPRKGEVVLYLPFERKDLLKSYTNRLIKELFNSNEAAAIVGDHLKHFFNVSEDKVLLTSVFELLSKAAYMSEEKQQIMLEFFGRFLDSPFTSKFTSDKKLHMFLSSWQVISASKYNNREAMNIVLHDIIECNLETQFLMTKVDRFDNTMIHYFCVWCYEREENLLIKLLDSISKKSAPFKPTVQNRNKQSPLNFVTYLGRHVLFERLSPLYKTSLLFKPTSFAGSELIKLIECGQKHATDSLSKDDSKVSIEFQFCRELPKFGSSTQYLCMLEIVGKTYR